MLDKKTSLRRGLFLSLRMSDFEVNLLQKTAANGLPIQAKHGHQYSRNKQIRAAFRS